MNALRISLHNLFWVGEFPLMVIFEIPEAVRQIMNGDTIASEFAGELQRFEES